MCVVVCVCPRTGVGARAGALPHQAFGRMEYYVVTQALAQAVHSEMVHETEDATAHARPLLTYLVAAFEQL